MSGIYLFEDQVSGLAFLQLFLGCFPRKPLPRVAPGVILLDPIKVLSFLMRFDCSSFMFSYHLDGYSIWRLGGSSSTPSGLISCSIFTSGSTRVKSWTSDRFRVNPGGVEDSSPGWNPGYWRPFFATLEGLKKCRQVIHNKTCTGK